MTENQIAEKFAEIVRPVTDKNGFELVRTEYVKENGNYYLRAFINKPGGITIDDCVLVSRIVSKKLDQEDYIEDAYTMEISSPGFMVDPNEGDGDSEKENEE
ncbi:Putative ribosome maturation factor RimP [Lachnospiraceae bacterium]|nr:Putative ribosome maturation factor RimP [Lachnospiraceae bacterium]